MEFRTVNWPNAELIRDTVGTLLCTHWPSSENEAAQMLQHHGFETVEGSRRTPGEGAIEYELTARTSGLSGQWFIENGKLSAIVLTFGGTRSEIEHHFEQYRVALEHDHGTPQYDEGIRGAPRLTWPRPTRELSLDAYWSHPETSVLMVALQSVRGS